MGQAQGENRAGSENPSCCIVFQTKQTAIFDNQQMAGILGCDAARTSDTNRLSAGGLKALPIPAIEVFRCPRPECTAGIGKDIMDVLLRNALFRTEAFKTRTEKTKDSIFGSQPQKSRMIRGHTVDCQIIEPLWLAKDAKHILLRLRRNRQHQ